MAAALVAQRRGQLGDVDVQGIARQLPWSRCAAFLRALPAGTASTATTWSTRLSALGDDHLVDLIVVRRQPWPSLAGLLRQAAEQLATSSRALLLLATIGRVVDVRHLAAPRGTSRSSSTGSRRGSARRSST